MKQIEGKSRRVLKYERMFFWYVPACAVFLSVLGVAALDWDWLALGMLVPGAMLGAVMGVLLRDAP